MCYLRFLSEIHPRTNTPLLATLVTGILSSLLSLVVGLQILVEMMSIGEFYFISLLFILFDFIVVCLCST